MVLPVDLRPTPKYPTTCGKKGGTQGREFADCNQYFLTEGGEVWEQKDRPIPPRRVKAVRQLDESSPKYQAFLG